MATSNLLNDKAIRAALKAAATSGNGAKLLDGEGLRLDVRPTGSGWWRFRYRLNGLEKMVSLGIYPAISLSDARARRAEARGLVSNGIDPSDERKAAKQSRKDAVVRQKAIARGEALPGTFESVAREWLTRVHADKVSAGHERRTRARLEKNIFPWLGSRPIGDIEPPELLELLRKIEDRGTIETAHRVKDACAQVFRYGIATGHCGRNPVADLLDALKPVAVRHFAAITDPKMAGALLRDMMNYPGQPLTGAALRLSALLLLRPGELRKMEWAWVDFDTATLTIPSANMKRDKRDKASGMPHFVPLAPQAAAILRDEVLPLTGGGRYVFPSLNSTGRPMSENTINLALRRMGYDRDTMTAHGFRAMSRTLIAERLGVAPEVIEAQLAHAVPDKLGRAYNRATYTEQRRGMMTAWADYLDWLRDGAQVLPLRPAREA